MARYIKYLKFNSTQKQDVAGNQKIKQELSRNSKNYQEISRMSENTAPVGLLSNKWAAFLQYNEIFRWMLARYVQSKHLIQDRSSCNRE